MMITLPGNTFILSVVRKDIQLGKIVEKYKYK